MAPARAEGDAALPAEHVLADGTRVTLRFICPEDAAAFRRAFARLSPRSRYQRFLGSVPELTDDMVTYLTQVDGERHVAIVATTDSHDLKEEIGLGVARFVCLDGEPGVAEAAVTVIDDAQGKGLGRLLLTALAEVALARGVRAFRGEVLDENARVRHLLAEVGASTSTAGGGTMVFDVPLHGPVDAVASEPSHPLRRLLRAAARGLGMEEREEPPRTGG